MKIATLILVFMGMMVTIPYLFVENAPFDAVRACLNDCGEIVIEHGIYHDIVSASIYYSLFITVAFGLPFLKPEMPKFMKVIFYALGFWVSSALFFEWFNLSFPKYKQGAEDYKVYIRFVVAFTALVITTQIENSWIEKKS